MAWTTQGLWVADETSGVSLTSSTTSWVVWSNISSTNSAYDLSSYRYGVDFGTTTVPLIHYTQSYTGTGDYTVHVPESPELRAEREKRYHRQQRIQQKAHRRGRRLLLRILSERQQEEYARLGGFRVVGSDGKVFMLRKRTTAYEFDKKGRPICSWCIHLPYGYNAEDTLIALKLMVETDAKAFRKIANKNYVSEFDQARVAKLFAEKAPQLVVPDYALAA